MKPHVKELSFIVKLGGAMCTAALCSLGFLYFFMHQGVGTDYGSAFSAIAGIYRKMNFYIAAAVFSQLVISCGVVFFLALRYSHKIAGPMFRLKLTVRDYMSGRAIDRVSFRQSDLLHETAEKFTDFLSFLHRRESKLEEIKKLIEKALADGPRENQESLRKIKALAEEFTQYSSTK
ncbi:MAG: hypothetical protein WCQ99_15800 [Pseudomonadota bacterium]